MEGAAVYSTTAAQMQALLLLVGLPEAEAFAAVRSGGLLRWAATATEAVVAQGRVPPRLPRFQRHSRPYQPAQAVAAQMVLMGLLKSAWPLNCCKTRCCAGQSGRLRGVGGQTLSLVDSAACGGAAGGLV